MCLDSDKKHFLTLNRQKICHITSYSTSVISNFSMIPIRWLLIVDSEIISSFSVRLLRISLFSFKTHAIQEKLIALLVKSTINFAGKTDIRTHPLVIHAISVFRVKFTVEFTSWAAKKMT